MSEALRRVWTTDAFLAWEAAQPARHELVAGQPVMMAGGTQAHNAIAVNLTATLRTLLHGSPCRPGGSDLRVVTGTGNVRYPDALVDCGPFQRESNNASEPRVVVELLSRSTAWIDLHDKLRDYDATASIAHYVLVSQDEPKVVMWTRGEEGRLTLGATTAGIEAVVDLPALAIALPMAEIYDSLQYGVDQPSAG